MTMNGTSCDGFADDVGRRAPIATSAHGLERAPLRIVIGIEPVAISEDYRTLSKR